MVGVRVRVGLGTAERHDPGDVSHSDGRFRKRFIAAKFKQLMNGM